MNKPSKDLGQYHHIYTFGTSVIAYFFYIYNLFGLHGCCWTERNVRHRICLFCPIWLVYLPIYLLASKNTAKHILQNNNFHLFAVHSCRDGRQLCFSAAYCSLSKLSINIVIELSFDFWVKHKVNYLYLHK